MDSLAVREPARRYTVQIGAPRLEATDGAALSPQAQAVHVTADVLSVLVSVYAYTGGAHGTTFFLPLTFDLGTGEPITLAALFRPGAAWGDTLAAHVERGVVDQLAAHLGAADARQALYAEGLDDVRRGEVAWTLGPDALRAWIPPYQLAAYAAGSFGVDVPYGALAPLARPGGLLARLAAE